MAIAIQPGLWIALVRGYTGDSLYTLNPWQIVGLVVLSTMMALLLFSFIYWKSKKLHQLFRECLNPSHKLWLLLLDILTTILLSVGALWIAPQIHYTYYQLIIDSLPMQWVVGGAFDVPRLLRLIILQTDGSIAEHATGICIWACIVSNILILFDRVSVSQSSTDGEV